MYVRCWNCSQDIECSCPQNNGVENVIPPILKDLYNLKRIANIIGDQYRAKALEEAIEVVKRYE